MNIVLSLSVTLFLYYEFYILSLWTNPAYIFLPRCCVQKKEAVFLEGKKKIRERYGQIETIKREGEEGKRERGRRGKERGGGGEKIERGGGEKREGGRGKERGGGTKKK